MEQKTKGIGGIQTYGIPYQSPQTLRERFKGIVRATCRPRYNILKTPITGALAMKVLSHLLEL